MIAVFPWFNMYVGGPFIVDQKKQLDKCITSLVIDKGMVWFNCLFASGLLLHPSAKHWTKIIRIPSKKTELTTAIGSWFTAPPRFDHFLPEELFEWPWVDAHSEQFSASKVIPLRKADWLQAFWFQFFLTATAAKNPMKTQPGAEWRDELYVVWWIH